jgi:hypothetical protein
VNSKIVNIAQTVNIICFLNFQYTYFFVIQLRRGALDTKDSM